MAFIPEDGTGLENANSYMSLAAADAHHADRGHTEWAAVSSALREAALVRATDYIDKRFGHRFRGYKRTRDQALQWPRFAAVGNDRFLLPPIPSQLRKATAEYALRALTNTPLAPDNDAVGLRANREKVGPIETDIRVNASASKSALLDPTSIPDYPEADLWIMELIESTMSRTLVRG